MSNPAPPAGEPDDVFVSPVARRPMWRWIKSAILVAALVWVAFTVADLVGSMRQGVLQLRFAAGWLFLSALCVAGAYLVLLTTWRFLLATLTGVTLSFSTTARIWFTATIGNLLPGRIWGVVQVSAMASEAGVRPGSTALAFAINSALNIATGLIVVGTVGSGIIGQRLSGYAWLPWVVAMAAFVAIYLLPHVLPRVLGFASDRLGKAAETAPLPVSRLLLAAGGNVVSWFLYGAALQFLSAGMGGLTAFSLTGHVSGFAASYVIGYLTFLVPAGMGVREASLKAFLENAGLATGPNAAALSIAFRLWLLGIQLAGAAFFWTRRARRTT